MVFGPHQVCTEWLLPPLLWVGGSLMLLNQQFHSLPIYMVGHTALGAWQSHPTPLPSLHGGEGSSFPGLFPSDDMVNFETAMGIKPGDSGVVIGYQVDEFTHTWSAEWFLAHSHIFPGFTGKVSSLTQSPLETRVQGLFLSGPSCCWLWTRLGFPPHQFH